MKTYQNIAISPSCLTAPTRGPVSGHTCVLDTAIHAAFEAARMGADRTRGSLLTGESFVMGSTPATKGAFWDFHAWSPPI